MITGQALRIMRKKLKLSQTELGQLCGLSGRIVSNIETNKRTLSQQEEEVLRRYFTEHEIPFLQANTEQSNRHVKIVIEKNFGSINADAITEIGRLIEAIKNFNNDWCVSCTL